MSESAKIGFSRWSGPGLGCAVMPENLPLLPGLEMRPLVDPEVFRQISLATVAGRPHSPAVAAAVAAAQHYRWPGGTAARSLNACVLTRRTCAKANNSLAKQRLSLGGRKSHLPSRISTGDDEDDHPCEFHSFGRSVS